MYSVKLSLWCFIHSFLGLQVWLGGALNQTRLAETFMDRVKLDKLESVLEPLLYMWRTQRHEKESFGDFCFRQVRILNPIAYCVTRTEFASNFGMQGFFH